jgi:hypothetical protein
VSDWKAWCYPLGGRWEAKKAGMAMAATAKSGGCGGRIADALRLGKCKCFVCGFADNGVQCGKYEACTDVAGARGLRCDGHGGG